jgi:predicted O-methyltransferase YrrM
MPEGLRTVKRLGRGALRLVGLRPPDYKALIRHGEVSMDNIELHGLVQAIRHLNRPPECVVEIGSYCGGSTVVIGRAAARLNPGVRLYAIEPFAFHEARYQYDYEELFDRNVAEWGLTANVVKVRMTSDQAARNWDRVIDFLYVDGDHGYEAVARDINNFIPLVRGGGLFALHDYKPVGKEGVKRAVDELVRPSYRQVFIAGSLICFEKPRGRP